MRRVVHPVEVGRGENVRRRTLLDLARKGRACRVACHNLGTGCFQERRVHVVERILHRGGGEHRDGLVLRGGRRGVRQRNAQNNQSKKRLSAENHGGSPFVALTRESRVS
jgi:hypothetical protein